MSMPYWTNGFPDDRLKKGIIDGSLTKVLAAEFFKLNNSWKRGEVNPLEVKRDAVTRILDTLSPPVENPEGHIGYLASEFVRTQQFTDAYQLIESARNDGRLSPTDGQMRYSLLEMYDSELDRMEKLIPIEERATAAKHRKNILAIRDAYLKAI